MSERTLESPENSTSPRKRKGLSLADAVSLAAVELPASGLHSNPRNLIPYFERLARLITPSPPVWLPPLLMAWSRSIFLGREVEQRQPSRAAIKKRLVEIDGAAEIVQRGLQEVAVREFLDAGGDEAMNPLSAYLSIVEDIRHRARHALKSPSLVNRRGNTKAGRGRALPSGTLSAQAYCALLIAETWKWFEGEYPPPRNLTAATAAGLYWRLAGGQVQSWGNNPSEAWRYHLRKIATLDAESDRQEYRRHLEETQRRAELIRDGS